MAVMDLLEGRRSYRRFLAKPVPQDVLEDVIRAVQLSSCGANRQGVRLVIVQEPRAVEAVHPLVHWAAYLPPEKGTPKPEERPQLYVAVVLAEDIPGDKATDAGIALANMTLAAWDKGVGSCILGNVDRPRLGALLGLAENERLHVVVAFGYPAHRSRVVPMSEETGVHYYLDEANDYCVPKRSLSELARYWPGPQEE